MAADDFLRDLEARMDALHLASHRFAARERARAEVASVRFEGRLNAGLGRMIEVELVTGGGRRGHLAAVGPGWLALSARVVSVAPGELEQLARPGVWVAAADHVESVIGLSGAYRDVADTPQVGRSLASVLRAVSRSPHGIVWHSVGGARRVGRVRATGQDHVVLQGAASSRVLRFAALGAFEVVATRRDARFSRGRR